MMSVNGEANGEGLRHAIAIVDTMTAIHSVAAINAALYARTSTGKGQHIDLRSTTPPSAPSATWARTT